MGDASAFEALVRRRAASGGASLTRSRWSYSHRLRRNHASMPMIAMRITTQKIG